MRKLVLLTAILMAALIASAPAMAEEILSLEPETTVVGAPGKAPETPSSVVEPSPGPKDGFVQGTVTDTSAEPDTDPTEETAALDTSTGNDGVAEIEDDDTAEDTAEDTSSNTSDAAKNSITDTGAPSTGDSAGKETGAKDNDSASDNETGDSKESVNSSGKETNDSKDGDSSSGKETGDDKGSGKGGDKGSGKGSDKGSGKNNDDGVDQDSDQDADSGDVDQDIDIVNTGDNVNMCIGIIQAVNTGNIQDSDQVAQKDSEAKEVELEDGSSITVTPQLVIDCRQIIYQIVTGKDSDGSKDKASKTGASKLAKTKIDLKSTYFKNSSAGNSSAKNSSAKNSSAKNSSVQQVRTGGSGTRVISTRAEAKAAQQPNATRRALPRTGGGLPISYAAVLGLCVGAPLIGGGLLLRRISR